MNGNTSGTLSGVLLTLVLLVLISIFFNKKIESNASSLEGWSWVLVVIGTIYTQAAVGLLDLLLPQWNAFVLGMLAYTFSGTPMAWGAFQRHREAEARARKAANE